MKRVEIDGWVLDCDPRATRAVYAGMERGGADECGCVYCRNFAAQRAEAFPPSAIELYDRLGVAIDREEGVSEMGPVDGLHFYMGRHQFLGAIVERGRGLELGGGFGVSFQTVSPQEDFGARSPLVQVDFSVGLPWVLAEAAPPWSGESGSGILAKIRGDASGASPRSLLGDVASWFRDRFRWSASRRREGPERDKR